MTAFELKLAAALAMTFDHAGYFYLPGSLWPRMIGRLSFPLFAWLIANGAVHTRDAGRYLRRLLLLAAVTQVPYALAVDGKLAVWDLNVLVTLSLGLVAILLMRRAPRRWLRVSAALACAAAAELVNADYGAFGVLSVAAFYAYYEDMPGMVLSQTALAVLETAHILVWTRHVHGQFQLLRGLVQLFGLLSLPLIACYNQRPGPRFRLLFYSLYPVEFTIVVLQRWLMLHRMGP